MIRRLFSVASVALITTISTCQAKNPYPTPLQQPEAPMPSPDALIPPPGENTYWPIRPDGQAFVLNQDLTCNYTDVLNRYYFNPSWRGEEWGPFQMYWVAERAVRTMPTWREYDEFSTLRIFNGWHKFWEKYSGYGP